MTTADERASTSGPVTIDASYSSLTCGAVGALIYGLGSLAVWLTPESTRLAWGLQVVGPLLVAVGLSTQLERMARRIGSWPVWLGILGLFVWALSGLPRRLGIAAVTVAIVGAGVWSLTTVAFMADPSLAQSATWGPLCFWGVYGAGIILGGVSVALVIARKARATRGRPPPPR